MAVKKSEIYSRIWQGCDVLRGGMDASQYKDYVLSGQLTIIGRWWAKVRLEETVCGNRL